MNTKSFFMRSLFVAFVALSAMYFSACGNNSSPVTPEQNVITGTISFSYNGASLTDATKWPQNSDTASQFPGTMKVAFVPLDPTTLAPRQGPVAAIPGLGAVAGIPFSALRNGVYEFSSINARDNNNNPVSSLPRDIYGVYVTYVNPFFTGQASQQFLNSGVVADLRSASSVSITDRVEMRVAETLMQSGRAGSATLSGTVTATGNVANWPAAPVGPPTAWAQGAEFIAILGFRDGTPPGVPGMFLVLPRPASGNSTTFATTMPLGTYRNITIARYKVDSAAPGGFRTIATLAQFSNPQTQQNAMTMDAGNRQAVWNVSIAL